MVALTFDDGPNGTATPKILDILEKYNVVATFFDLGTCMENYPILQKGKNKLVVKLEVIHIHIKI